MTISLIIPIYNAARYLSRCLDSVVAQTYKDFECLLIDDGSTDGSLEICKDYVRKYPCFSVFHKDNGGEWSARNYGLEKAKGDWICWIDADDSVSPDYLSGLIEDAKDEDDVHMVMQGLIRIEKEKTNIVLPSGNSGSYLLHDESSFFFQKVNVKDFGVSFSKLFRRDVIFRNDIQYSSNIILAVDLDFLLRYLSCCNKIVVSTKANYNYYINPQSLSHRIYTYEQEVCGLYQLSSSWQKLINDIGNTTGLVTQHSQSVADYTHRVVLSCYMNNNSYSQRLHNLRSIPSVFTQIYGNYFQPTMFLRMVSWLISRRLFWLADTILFVRFCVFC